MDKNLLVKYIEGSCTIQEKVIVTEWLDSHPENMKEYMTLRKLYDISIWQTPLKGYTAQLTKKRNFFRSWKTVYVEVIKVAAIFIVFFVISHYFFVQHKLAKPITLETLHVPAGQRADITLEDGTHVWLNANTTLTFPNQFTGDIREVKLNGEGYFKVASNKTKPFIVRTEKYAVRVLGTTFNIMAYSGEDVFETSLLEGSVEVLEPGNSKNVKLLPKQLVRLQNDRLVVSPIKSEEYLLWKEGILSFDDELFPQMVKKLELYFDLKIEVKNDKILKYRCTGKFRTKDGVEHILKVLQLSNKFNYTINDKRNTIVIK